LLGLFLILRLLARGTLLRKTGKADGARGKKKSSIPKERQE
jgi:hypothetical protein